MGTVDSKESKTFCFWNDPVIDRHYLLDFQIRSYPIKMSADFNPGKGKSF